MPGGREWRARVSSCITSVNPDVRIKRHPAVPCQASAAGREAACLVQVREIDGDARDFLVVQHDAEGAQRLTDARGGNVGLDGCPEQRRDVLASAVLERLRK